MITNTNAQKNGMGRLHGGGDTKAIKGTNFQLQDE